MRLCWIVKIGPTRCCNFWRDRKLHLPSPWTWSNFLTSILGQEYTENIVYLTSVFYLNIILQSVLNSLSTENCVVCLVQRANLRYISSRFDQKKQSINETCCKNGENYSFWECSLRVLRKWLKFHNNNLWKNCSFFKDLETVYDSIYLSFIDWLTVSFLFILWAKIDAVG